MNAGLSVRAWADAEFGTKGAVEVREVAEARLERNVEDPGLAGRKLCRGGAQPQNLKAALNR